MMFFAVSMNRRPFKSVVSLSSLGILLPVFVFCGRDYNPFADVSNARAALRSASFADGDTVNIFSSDTIEIALAAASLVDSFSVTVDGNRWFTDTLVVRWGGQGTTVYRFYCSLYDTGWHEITIRTYRGGGSEELAERLRVYASSPLSQAAVNKLFGEPVALTTPGVAATDVRYHWDFGRGVVINSPRPDTTVEIWDAGYNDSGWLWVSDVKGTCTSPRVYFPYSFDDRQGPSIICVNEGFVGKDTILSGGATFPLRLKISDRGERRVYEAFADGKPFSIVQDLIYIKVLERMDTVRSYRMVSVRAVDDARHLNETTKVFYVGYDTSYGGKEGVALEVLIPPADSLVFSTASRYLFGVVWNYTGDSVDLDVHFSVNGMVSPDVYAVRGSAVRNEWHTTVTLSGAVNTVNVAVTNALGHTVADTSMTLLFDAGAPDTLPPQIVEVTAGGRPANRLYVSDDTVHLKVVAFDQGSGVSAVTVNGVSMISTQAEGGHVWGARVGLVHTPAGNNFRIIARDRKSLADTAVVVIFRNKAPSLVQAPRPPQPLFVGAAYTDRISVSDGDNDNVRITKRRGPDSLRVDAFGNITWHPLAADTGSWTIEIQYTDGYEPQYYSYKVTVRDTVDFSMPSFASREEDFPVFVETADTMRVELSIAPGRGSPPFTYAAIAEAGVTQPWVNGTTVTWVPAAKDTGWRRLYVTVRDAFSHADTLVPIILVAPPNRPCSLAVSYDIDTLPGGLLDFTASTAPETLSFVIHDPDHPASEHHTVWVNSDVVKVIGAVDSGGVFQLVVNPSYVSSDTDTVVVTVRDRAGYSYSITLRMLGQVLKRVYVNTVAAGVTENVYDFPLLVRLTSSDFPFGKAAPDGHNIRFRKSNGVPMPYEIERWDAGAGVAEVWVKVDTVRGSNATQYFEMYVDRSAAAAASNGAAVFDTANGFAGVWHLNDNTSNRNVIDATGRNNGTKNDNTAENSVQGMIAGALEFNAGHNEYIDCGSAPEFDNMTTMTWSAWIWPTSASQEGRILDKSPDNIYGDAFAMRDNSPSGSIRFYSPYTDIIMVKRSTNGDVPYGQWSLVTVTWTGSPDAASCRLYRNGVELSYASSQNGSGSKKSNADYPLRIGNRSTATDRSFDGIIDEVRVETVVRSRAWIRLSYETQKPGSTVVTVDR